MTEEERNNWLLERMNSIGASEAAATAALHPWMTPLRLYLNKTDHVFALEDGSNNATRAGNFFEKPILQYFLHQKFYGESVEDMRTQVSLREPSKEYITATIDMLDPDGNIVEAKFVGKDSARGWGANGERVPDYVKIQVNQQMYLAEKDKCYIAALIGGPNFVIKEIGRDERVVKNIINCVDRFWERVQDRKPPGLLPRDGSKEVFYSGRNFNETMASGQTIVDVRNYQEIKKQISDLTKEKEETKRRILSNLTGSKAVIMSSGETIRILEQKRKGYTVKDSTIYKLEIK